MDITTASLSRQGTRASNQDQTGECVGERSACFVVCDGIAGLPGGEVAAEMAAQACPTEVAKELAAMAQKG